MTGFSCRNVFIISKMKEICMSEENKLLKNFIPVQKINNDEVLEVLTEIMRYKAEQIRRYGDSVNRELFRMGIATNITTKVSYGSTGIDVLVHFDVLAVRSDKIRELEKKAKRYNKLQFNEDINFNDMELNISDERNE